MAGSAGQDSLPWYNSQALALRCGEEGGGVRSQKPSARGTLSAQIAFISTRAKLVSLQLSLDKNDPQDTLSAKSNTNQNVVFICLFKVHPNPNSTSQKLTEISKAVYCSVYIFAKYTT